MSYSKADFDRDIRDVHLVYDFPTNNGSAWRYEIWFFSENRIVYNIHGGPMAGRANYQTCTFQCIKPGELWQCNWLEETGTICSVVYDFVNKRTHALIGFSKGHWENPAAAHGDKRNQDDFARWRKLAQIGTQTDRHILCKQGNIIEIFKGPGTLEPIDESWPTI